MNYIPFHIHTSFSLLDGVVKPDKFATRCKELGYEYAMITDHGNISGAIKFANAMQKEGIKPILGCEFYLSYDDPTIKDESNRKLYHMVVAAKNKESWYKLIQAVSVSNHPDNFYYKPRLDLESLANIIGDSCFIFSGHPGSYLWDFKTEEEIIGGINKLKSLFGENNVYLEIQRFMQDEDVNQHIEILLSAAKKTNTRAIACQDIHYTNQKDVDLHRVVLSSNLGKTLPKINAMKDKPMSCFFETDKFYLHSMNELKALGHTNSELDMSDIIEQVEEYKLSESPKLPTFSDNEFATLKELCKDGWRAKHKVWGENYRDRLKYELGVIEKWNLSGYFLIVAEYIQWAKDQGMLIGPGRGSSGGSLACYLMSITEIDPIPYKLLFERFINEARMTTGALPDIDTDFPANRRDEVIEHLKDKYGKEYVCQIATFGTLKGKAALKEVFRVFEACDFETINKITKPMPDEASIADELEEQGEESIIHWCLVNQPKIFKDYCRLTEDGELEGEYAQYFKLAIELEGIHKSQGKHAAGVIVASEKLADIAPIIYDKNSGEPIVALDKKDAEKIGLVKFDLLGLSALDKLMAVQNLLKTGSINAESN